MREGRRVLFSGTPCEVEGLLKFLGGESESPLLLTVDVVCRAVPSPLVLNTYLNMIDGGNVTGLRFRDKRKYGYLYSQLVAEKENSRPVCEGIDTNIYICVRFSRTFATVRRAIRADSANATGSATSHCGTAGTLPTSRKTAGNSRTTPE